MSPTACPHQGPRERGAVPILCSLCEVEIAQAPHSRCPSCKGDGRRDPGWETGGQLWGEAVLLHLESADHLARVPPPVEEGPPPVLQPPPAALDETPAPDEYSSGGSPARTPTRDSRALSSRFLDTGKRAWSGSSPVPCPRCGLSVRRDNLGRHVKRHGSESVPTP